MDQKITILSKPPFPIIPTRNPYYRLRYYLNYLFILSKNNALPLSINGPQSLINNLNQGLVLNNCNLNINPTVFNINPYVGVLSDTNALKWAIKAKEKYKIKKLVAGPNLVILPTDENNILSSTSIDIIVTPSKWVSDLYCFLAPQIKQKIREWPVGIDTDFWKPLVGSIRNKWLLYDKSEYGGKELVQMVESELVTRGIKYQKILYGSYSPEEYKELLDTAAAMIVITPSESQGLAQFEAWSCNVPTLVWDRGFWKSNDSTFTWQGATSSPYLSDSCGMRFNKANDFVAKLDTFISNLNIYSPREYIMDSFTLEISAKNYVDLFYE